MYFPLIEISQNSILEE